MRKQRVAVSRIAIVAIVVVIVVVAGAATYLSLSSGGQTTATTTPQTSIITSSPTQTGGAKPFKVIFVAPEPETNYFTEFFVSSMLQAAKQLSTPQRPVEATAAYNIPLSQVKAVTKSYADQGYNLIFLSISFSGAPDVEIALNSPNVYFAGFGAYPNGYNAATYDYSNPRDNLYSYNATNLIGWDENVEGAYYVAGVAAALATKTNKLGYIGAFDVPFVGKSYNNFVAGVHSVNPNIPVFYAFTNDWSDPSKGAAQADAMVARGVDVIAPVGDTQTNGANQEAIQKGIYGIGYVNDLNSLSATNMLGSVYFNATTLCRMIIQDAMNNQLVANGKGRFYNLALPQQGQEFILNPALVQSGTLSADAVAKINAARQAILSGAYVPTTDGTFPPQPQG